MRLSFSKLEMFLQCERKFWYSYVQKAPRTDNLYFQAGNLFHSMIENHFRPDPDATWHVPSLVTEELYQNICDAFHRFQSELLVNLRGDLKDVERRFSTKEWGGKLDFIASEGPPDLGLTYPLVLDWKTCHRRRSKQFERDPNLSPQLALYALETGLQSAAFVEVDLFSPFAWRVKSATFSEGQLVWWRRWLENQRTALLSRGQDIKAYRLALPGDPLCSLTYCPFYLECAGGNNYKETK